MEAGGITIRAILAMDLLKDLTALPWLKKYQLADAAEKPPEEEEGRNIEGLSAAPDGPLLIGFRNPSPMGKRFSFL
jgi:hypothetical protein